MARPTFATQVVGKIKINEDDLTYVDLLSFSGHKIYAPKGVGVLYRKSRVSCRPLIIGGHQERGLRAGTENLAFIVGLAKALETCYSEMELHQKIIMELKDYMREQLTFQIPGIEFNGETSHDKSLYTVLNCRFPHHPDAEMVLFNLDIE